MWQPFGPKISTFERGADGSEGLRVGVSPAALSDLDYGKGLAPLGKCHAAVGRLLKLV